MTHLNDSVLLLNRYWQACNIASARRVFCLLANDHVAVLHEAQPFSLKQWQSLSYGYEGNDVIRTPHCQFRIPHIGLLLKFDRLPHKDVRFTRHNIFERDRNTCQYCEQRLPLSELNLDHIVPRASGGQSTWTNMVTSCIRCNSLKGERSLSESGMKLLRQPQRPKWRPATTHICLESVMKKEWEPFLDIASWSVELTGVKK